MLSSDNRAQSCMADCLQLKVQGKKIPYYGAHDVGSLLKLKGENIAYVNVRVNGVVLEDRDFENIPLRDGDSVDFLYYMGGGTA
ncbi:MAG: sulfur carrier protein ThiS [Thermoleophilia bacterium]